MTMTALLEFLTEMKAAFCLILRSCFVHVCAQTKLVGASLHSFANIP